MQALLAACDLLLLLGATLRTVRLIVADDVPGKWWIRDPLLRRIAGAPISRDETALTPSEARRVRTFNYVDGLLSCPFCIGLWIAAAMVLILTAVGGPGDAPDWWRITAGILTLNWVAAHLGVRAGDTEDDD